MYASVYEMRRRVLGRTHPDTLTSANNLAAVKSLLGDLAGARKLHEWEYRTSRRLFGPNHPATLTSANNLALTLADLGDLVGARRLQKSVYEARQGVLGPEHPDSLASANNLAQTLLALGDHAGCGTLYGALLQTLCTASVASEVAFTVAGNIPMLAHPSLPWPEAVLTSLRDLLPRLSRLLTQRLEVLPQESWDQPYARYQRLHRQWLAFAAQFAPEQMLQALSGLHGIRSFSTVQAELADVQRVALSDEGERSAAAAGYLEARQALNAMRERIADRIARTPGAPELPGLRVEERDLTQGRERAEARLAQAAPDLAATVGALRTLRSDELTAGLAPGDAWLTFLPGLPACAYLLLPGHEPAMLEIGDLDALGQSCNAYVAALRSAHRGLLRDNEPASRGMRNIPGHAATDPIPPPTLAGLRLQAGQAFWQPLLSAMQGVRRLHLVTGAGYHDLLLEFALPPELGLLQVLRYCGLPAYQRSLMPDLQGALAPLHERRLSVVVEDNLRSPRAIPFTRLDPLLAERAGLVHRLTDDEIALLASDTLPERSASPPSQPAGLRLMLSTHGRTAGSGTRLGGQLLLPCAEGTPERWLQPVALAARGQGIELLWSLSCWGARVGDSGQGDAYGAISALQLAGLRAAIGCLAPVEDFYTPLLSAFIWQGLLQGLDLASALQQAGQRLRHGSWAELQPTLQPLRLGFRTLMLEILRRACHGPGEQIDDAPHRALLRGVVGWSLPASWRRRLEDDADIEWLNKVLPTSRQARERFVDGCLDVLLREPAERDPRDRDEDAPVVEAIEHLCAVTVTFGRG
jgi:hypothetical protein